MPLLNTSFIVFVDYTRICFYIKTVPWHISVLGNSVTWHKMRKKVNNLDWQKSKTKPYLHQISLDCIEKLVECIKRIDIEVMYCNTLPYNTGNIM